MGIVGKVARHVVRRQLFQVGEQLDEQLLLAHAEVTEEVARHAVAARPPHDVATVLRQMIEGDAHLAPIHQLEREVVDVCDALVEERQHVVVAIDVQPHALGRQSSR